MGEAPWGVFLNSTTFDEQCRLCRFLNGDSSCAARKLETVRGLEVCTGYEPEEI